MKEEKYLNRMKIALKAAKKYGTIVGAICLHEGMIPEDVNEWEKTCEMLLGTSKYIMSRTAHLRDEITIIQNMR